MPKMCDGCHYYTRHEAATTCPACSGLLKITFLPQPGEEARPVRTKEEVPTLVRRPVEPAKPVVAFLTSPKVFVALAALALLIVGFAVRTNLPAEQTDADVKPGMHISKAAKLLDTGAGFHHPNTVRFRDRFSEDDRSDGEFTLARNSERVRVKWADGFVTSVERGDSAANAGARRQAQRRMADEE